MKVGFVTDIHEDISNLELGIKILYDNNCDEIICLGDIVGFAIPFYKNITSRDADACVTKVKSCCSSVVIGNHDLYAIKKLPANKAGFNYPDNWYFLDYETRARLAKNKIWLYEDNEVPCSLSKESISFLNSLSETKVINTNSLPFLISHFCYPDFSGSSIHFPAEGFHLKNHFTFAEENNCRISFSGHGHPEGCLVGNSERIYNLGFGIHNINDEPLWIVAPSIAKTSRKNGVLIFNSNLMQLQIIPLTK